MMGSFGQRFGDRLNRLILEIRVWRFLIILALVPVPESRAITLTAFPWHAPEGVAVTNDVGVLGDPAAGNVPMRYLSGATQDLLQRDPTESDQRSFSQMQTSLRMRAAAALEWVSSAEARTPVIRDLFQHYLRRDPSAPETASALRQFGAGVTQDELSVQLLVSAEYAVTRTTTTAYANAVYPDLLGRPPTAAERTGLQTWLNQGGRRDDYLRSLQKTSEYRQRVLDQAATRFLGHTLGHPLVEPAEYLEILTLNLSLENLWAELLASDEFFQAHGATFTVWRDAALAALKIESVRPASTLLAMDPAQGQGARAFSILQGKEYYFTQLNLNYAMFLGRAPSAIETNAWVNQSGLPLALETMRGVLLGSDEYYARAGSVYGLAQMLYQAVLSRTPSAAEITELQNYLNAGGTRERYARLLTQTAEYRETFARALFRNTYIVNPTTNQLSELTSLLAAGQSESQMHAHLFGSFDYAERARTNSLTTNVVKQLHQDLLGRNPIKQAELDTLPASSRTREMVVRTVLSSESYFNALVPAYYQAYLGRTPTTNELTFSRQGFYRGQFPESLQIQLLGSTEYYTRTGGKKDAYLTSISQALQGKATDDNLRRLWTNNLVVGGDLSRFVSVVLAANATHKTTINNLSKPLLGRGVDGAEMGRWLARRQLGWNYHDTLTDLLASDEYYEKLGGAPDVFTQQLAWVLLGKTNATLRAQLLPDLVRLHPGHLLILSSAAASSDFFTQSLVPFYLSWLGRKPTATESQTHTAMATQQATLESVYTSVLSSAEFYTRTGGSPAGFVSALFRGLLDRASVTADVTAYQKVLTDGGTRASYATQMLAGAERRGVTVKAAYKMLLRRSATDRELVEGVTSLGAGQRLEELWVSIASTPEFGARVQDEVLSEFWSRITTQPAPMAILQNQITPYDLPSVRAFMASTLLSGPEYFRLRVNDLHLHHLKRAATTNELNAAVLLQFSESSLLDVEANVLGSAESYSRAGSTPTAWLTALFLNLFGRDPTEAERKSWVPLLTTASARVAASRQLLEAPEHRRRVIKAAAVELLGREGSEAEIAAGIQAGVSAFTASSIASKEYYTRVSGDYEATIDWGDGTQSFVVLPSGRTVNPILGTHTFANDGEYPITISLTAGATRSIATNLVTITNVLPVVTKKTLEWDGTRLNAMLAIADSGINTWRCTIDYGDGTPKVDSAILLQPQISVAHIYNIPGSFTLRATVSDDRGGTNALEFTLAAIEPGPVLVPLAASIFSSGVDGWQIFPRPPSYLTLPQFSATGGNPGGSLSATGGEVTAPWYWDAPPSYLGNKSELKNGWIEFDLWHHPQSPLIHGTDLVMLGVANNLILSLNPLPGIPWSRYRILVATQAGWMDQATGTAATPAQLDNVLAQLKGLRIRGQFSDTRGTTGLDNVRLLGTDPGAVPELKLKLTSGPAPSTPGLEIVWSSTNRTYQLQTTTRLPASLWTNVPGTPAIVAGKSRLLMTLTNTTTQYFRLTK